MKLDIIDRLESPAYYGATFPDLASWRSWLVWLKAIFALPMDRAELELYRKCTSRQDPPTEEPKEIFTICGRRSGKSHMTALVAVHLACFGGFEKYLHQGETGAVIVMATNRVQARIVWRYIKGLFEAIPILNRMVVTWRSDELELSNGVSLQLRTADFRGLRGLTVCAAVCDELAFFDTGDNAANSDEEIFRALRPAMASIPNSKLLAISSPYARTGVLFEMHKQYFGTEDPHTLIWSAATVTMNPTISEDLIRREIERDPEAGRAEWLGEFRSDLESAFNLEAIEACIIPGRTELPPSRSISYVAFTDPSGGRSDSFTLAIGHKSPDGEAVIDLLQAWKAPFDPSLVVAEIAATLKRYRVASIVGDNYAGEWAASEFRKHGIVYEQSAKNKSELYLGMIPAVNSRQVELPDSKDLIGELRRLERRRGRTGRDAIDHPAGGHDDLANSAAGVCWLVLNEAPPMVTDLEINWQRIFDGTNSRGRVSRI